MVGSAIDDDDAANRLVSNLKIKLDQNLSESGLNRTVAENAMRNLRLWVAVATVVLCGVPKESTAQSGNVPPAAAKQDAGAPVVGETATPASGLVKSGNPLWAIPLSTLSATRDRPLFSSLRRPPPPPIPSAPPPPPPPVLAKPVTPPAPPPFTLLGTIIGDRTRIGVFLNDQSKAVTRMREGEGDSGWTLRSVDPRSAVLEKDGRMETLDLPVVSSSIAGAHASPPPRVSGFSGKGRGPLDNSGGL